MMRFLAVSQRLGAWAVIGVLAAAPTLAQEARLAVVGEGRVAVVPDMAVLSLGVEARDATAAGALSQVSQTLAAVMAVIETAGIAATDVQSSGVFLQPVYEQGPRPDSAPVQTGFSATSDLSVRVRDVATLGALLDDVAAAGGNRFSGLSWDVQNRAPLLDAARRAAVADGLAKAALYAGAAGVPLGQIVQMAEDGADPALMPMMDQASLRAMPMAAGEIEIAARLRMVFALGE